MSRGWKGVSFPFRFIGGKVAMSTANIGDYTLSHINESIIQILGTLVGERPLCPEFGLANRMMFSSFNKELTPYYQQVIKEALSKKEFRIEADKTNITFDTSDIDNGLVTINIGWVLKNTTIPGSTNYNIPIREVSR